MGYWSPPVLTWGHPGRCASSTNPTTWTSPGPASGATRSSSAATAPAKNAYNATSNGIQEQEELMAALHELRGLVLGCYCTPHQACHAKTLVQLENDPPLTLF